MRAHTLLLATVAALLAASLGPASTEAAATPEYLRPVDLRTGAGWQAINEFRLDWEIGSPLAGTPPPTAIHYRILDASGAVVTPTARVPWTGNELRRLRVPSGPGAYTAEVWLEDEVGQGPAASARLLFDDSRPAAPGVAGPSAWLGAGVPARLVVGPPGGPQPPSGIAGYAVSVDRAEAGSPCPGSPPCAAAEVDLPGAGGGPLSLGTLPEGINFAHVVAISGSGVSSAVRDLVVRVDPSPPRVALGEIPAGWATGPVRVSATATDPDSGMTAAGPAGPFTALAVDGAAATVAAGPSVATTVSGDGVHRIEFYARDAAGNAADGKAGAAAPSSALVRIDSTPPRVWFAATQDPAEPERIEAFLSDALSGPSASRGSIAVRPTGSRRRFEPISTAAFAGRLVARWDSEAHPPGSYEFRATGYDAAGNGSSGDRRRGGARMVLANPLKRATLLRFGFGGRTRLWQRKRSLPYGHRAVVSGRLTSSTGAPLPGRQVELVETFGSGADPARRVTTAMTAGDGAFGARLRPGPSRQVEVRFPGDAVLTSADGAPLLFRVPSAVGLRASAVTAPVGGRPVIFSGRIGRRGATLPPVGIAVELQFRLAGGEWSEFRTVQTDRRARFRYAYAFSDDDSRGVRFQFRAFVPSQEGWPYEPGASRAVTVTGR
jgi:hypothetical protein